MFKNKKYSWGNRKLARVFAGVGGYTNALAIVSLGITVSHVTGIVTNIPIQFFKPDFYYFFIFLGAIIAYLFGAMLGYYLLLYNGPGLPLVIEAIVFILIGLLSPSHIIDKNILSVFAAICMGLQNAITSRSPMDRTTHLTGLITDLGIAIVKGNRKHLRAYRNIILSFFLGATFAVFIFQKIGSKGFLIPGFILIIIIYYERENILEIRKRLIGLRDF